MAASPLCTTSYRVFLGEDAEVTVGKVPRASVMSSVKADADVKDQFDGTCKRDLVKDAVTASTKETCTSTIHFSHSRRATKEQMATLSFVCVCESAL